MTAKTRVRWRRNKDAEPARVYDSDDGRYEIVWDPAGERPGEPGGWWLREGGRLLGIFPTLKAAKGAVRNGGENDG
jgi:hypothetical protein